MSLLIPAYPLPEMKSGGASIEAMQAVIGASLANRAHGEEYSRLHAPAWEMSAGFDCPSWLAALECLDVEEFDGEALAALMRTTAQGVC